MIIDHFAVVPPNGFCIVPNGKARILYTDGLASCLGLIVLVPGELAILAHVVSADSLNDDTYFDELIAKIVEFSDENMTGASVRIMKGAKVKNSSDKALLNIKELFKEYKGCKVSDIENPGSELLFNTQTGVVLNAPVSGKDEDKKSVQMKLQTAMLKQLEEGYKRKSLALIGGAAPVKVSIAKQIDDQTSKPQVTDTKKKSKEY